jgi:hypothetical protein
MHIISSKQIKSIGVTSSIGLYYYLCKFNPLWYEMHMKWINMH